MQKRFHRSEETGHSQTDPDLGVCLRGVRTGCPGRSSGTSEARRKPDFWLPPQEKSRERAATSGEAPTLPQHWGLNLLAIHSQHGKDTQLSVDETRKGEASEPWVRGAGAPAAALVPEA